MRKNVYIDMNIPVHYDPNIGTRGQGYNLGDILNMPVFWAQWTSFHSIANLSVVASQLPNSIAGLYYNCRSDGLGAVTDDPIVPYRPRLLCAVNQSIALQPELQPMLQTLQDDSVLCVHVRSGDYGPVTNDFLRVVEHLSKQFAKIVVLSGVHCNGNEQFIALNKAKLNQCLARIHALVPHAIFDFNHSDAHVCYMARARNLLVHTGGFSILGSLVFSGKRLYVTSAFQPLKKKINTKLWHNLNIPHQVVDVPSSVIDMRFDNSEMQLPRLASEIKSEMPTMQSSRVQMPTMQSSRVPMPTMHVKSALTKGIAIVIPPRNKFSKNIMPMRLLNK